MKYSILSQNKTKISKIGFGCWGLSGDTYGKISIRKSLSILKYAFEKGINFYDTSSNYGDGKVEKILGSFIKKNKISRKKIILCTKGGLIFVNKNKEIQKYDTKTIENEINKSLANLNTKYIDIYLLHSPRKKNIKKNSKVFKFLKKKQKSGLIKFYGVSPSNPSDALYYLKNFSFDFLQINFNLMDQRILDLEILEICKKKNVKIIIRTPLTFGFLTNKVSINNIKKNQYDHRSFWDYNQLLKWKMSVDLFKSIKEKLSYTVFALKYCLYFKSVTTVIPGMMNTKEVKENIKACDGSNLKKSQISQIRNVYLNNIFMIKKRKRLYY